MEYDTLETNIKNWISVVAGIVDFCPLDQKNGIDFENNGIIIQKSRQIKNGIDLSLGLIILVNLNAKIIVEEIYQVLNYRLEKNNLKISSLSVYIKGIK
ncbi:hypothetical protein [Metamycoplasma alkalescens]|uniref:Asp23/Gls24 family envelope stress response protein n=2 Tax=Metamycoplasma alkalescens TaxID=45363 RepID=N9TZV9_9BACT|nr:hypothetical protein [Metamycoplasma alkalescens]ENY53807.1 Hypothetical protein MALK_4090 [Metamycoplasma alkalescens 14918]PYF42181.1 hypothetical protein BCF88_1175 [Metamycoplasma alkalescens]SYV90495.1 Uncharacterised protein [Metamycoplasma alkalescens]